MPAKYEIEIDDRSVLIVVRQYDENGNEVVIQNIMPPSERSRRIFEKKAVKASRLQSNQARIVRYVEDRNRKEEFPTFQEIADALALSKTNVNYHVHELCKVGILEMKFGKFRTLRVART